MCDNHTGIFLQYQRKATTKLRTMLKCYLWVALCLQFALIKAGAGGAVATKARRGGGSGGVLSALDAQEHVHIKVHIPDVSRRRTRPPTAHRSHSQHEHPRSPSNNKKVLPTLPTHSGSSKELPYEFDFYGLNDEDNSLLTTDLMHGNKYGPVVFTSNIQSGTTQHPMSQQFMRQLFTPEIMSALKADTDENNLGMQYGFMEEPAAIDTSDMMKEYFEKLNQPKSQRSTTITHTPKSTHHKRKKYGNTGIGESYPKESLQQQFYNTILKEHSKPTTPRKSTQQHYQRQQQKLQQYSPSLPPLVFHENFKAFQQDFEDDATSSSTSDELEAVDDISSSASTSASMEDMTAAFNRLKPISYQDMYGEYATLITTATSLSSSSTETASNHHIQQQPQLQKQQQHQQQQRPQHGFSLHHETIPTYTSTITTPYTANNWLQQYQQRPEKQQQIHYKPHHQQQKQQQLSKKHKPKSQQTQFVLQPTTYSLASSPSSSSSSSSASASASSSSTLSTAPISSGFGDSTNSIASSYSSTWSIPYDFVQQSHQQQLAAQQHPQQQHRQQHRQSDYKLTPYKKRKNRTKRKRNRIIVE